MSTSQNLKANSVLLHYFIMRLYTYIFEHLLYFIIINNNDILIAINIKLYGIYYNKIIYIIIYNYVHKYHSFNWPMLSSSSGVKFKV